MPYDLFPIRPVLCRRHGCLLLLTVLLTGCPHYSMRSRRLAASCPPELTPNRIYLQLVAQAVVNST